MLDGYVDTSAFRRELDGICQHVPDYLLQPASVSVHDIGRRGIGGKPQVNLLGDSDRPEDINSSLRQGQKIHGFKRQVHRPCNDSRHVEEVVDDERQGRGVAFNGLDGMAGACVRQLLRGQHPRPSEYRIERRAQLVRHHGDEVILETIRFIRFFGKGL